MTLPVKCGTTVAKDNFQVGSSSPQMTWWVKLNHLMASSSHLQLWPRMILNKQCFFVNINYVFSKMIFKRRHMHFVNENLNLYTLM